MNKVLSPSPAPAIRPDCDGRSLLRVSDAELLAAINDAQFDMEELADPFEEEEGEGPSVSWVA